MVDDREFLLAGLAWATFVCCIIIVLFISFWWRLHKHLQNHEKTIRAFEIVSHGLCGLFYILCCASDIYHIATSLKNHTNLYQVNLPDIYSSISADIFYFLATLTLFVTFIGRAHLTFKGTKYQFELFSLTTLIFVVFFVFEIVAMIAYLYGIVTSNYNDRLEADCFVVLMICEALMSNYIIYLFLSKMHNLIAISTDFNGHDDDDRSMLTDRLMDVSNCDNYNERDNYNYSYNQVRVSITKFDSDLLNLVTKYGVISVVAMLSGLLWYLTKFYQLYWDVSFSSQTAKILEYITRELEIVICMYCIFITFVFNKRFYQSSCFCCHRCCFQCCFGITKRTFRKVTRPSSYLEETIDFNCNQITRD